MYDYKKVLPIGTVVLLKNADKRLMILGYQRSSASDPNRIYDYCGCTYPEGFISPEKTAIFDHDDIERIFYVGFQNSEHSKLAEQIRALVAKRAGEVAQ